MPDKSAYSRMKGKRFERKLVNEFKSNDIECRRTYGSSGLSEGLPAEVDLVITINNRRIFAQAKVRKQIPELFKIVNTDINIIGESSKGEFVVLKLNDYIKMLKEVQIGKSNK